MYLQRMKHEFPSRRKKYLPRTCSQTTFSQKQWKNFFLTSTKSVPCNKNLFQGKWLWWMRWKWANELNGLGHSGWRDRKRDWDVQKWRKPEDILSSAPSTTRLSLASWEWFMRRGLRAFAASHIYDYQPSQAGACSLRQPPCHRLHPGVVVVWTKWEALVCGRLCL